MPLPTTPLAFAARASAAAWSPDVFGSSLRFLGADFFSDTGCTAAAAAGDSVKGITSSVGTLKATRTDGSCTLRQSRVPGTGAPSVWCGADATGGGWTINGINLTSAASFSVAYLHRLDMAWRLSSVPWDLYPGGGGTDFNVPIHDNDGNDQLRSGTGSATSHYPLQSGQALTRLGATGLWEAVCWVCNNGTTTVYRLSARGLETATVAFTYPAGAVADFAIGGGHNGGKYFGEFAKYTVIDRPLTQSEAVSLLGYLLAGVTMVADSTKPLVVAGVNSLTVGVGTTGADGPYPARLAKTRTPQSMTCLNYGLSGRDSANFLNDYPVTVKGLFAGRSRADDCVIIWDITNSISNGRTGAQAYGDAKAACQAVKADYPTLPVLIATGTPRNSNLGVQPDAATFDAVRLTANGFVEADFPTASGVTNLTLPGPGVTYADGCLRYGRITNIANLADADNAAFFSDKTHLTNAGQALVDALNEAAFDYLNIAKVSNLLPSPVPSLALWWNWLHGPTPDTTGVVAAYRGDVVRGWTGLVGNSATSTDGSPRYGSAGVSLNGTNQDVRLVFPCPLPVTWVVVGTFTGVPLDFTGVIESEIDVALSGILIRNTGTPRLGYSWGGGAATYGFNTGPALPATGTRCLMAVAVEATKATLFLRTAAGLSTAVNTNAHAALAANTSRARVGSDAGSANRWAPLDVEDVKACLTTLTAADVESLWAAA